jgi:translocation and assembly module TamB
MHAGGAKRFARRAARVITVAVAGLLLFVLTALAGVLVFIETPPGRKLAVSEVNRVLAPSFRGRFEIRRLGALGPFGVSGADATLYDPDGNAVLSVRGVRVQLATWGLVHSLLFGKREPLTVVLRELSMDELDLRLDSDPSGQLVLLDALAPKSPSGPPDPNARGLRLEITKAVLGHGWAHGTMTGAPPLDVALDGLRGSFTYAPDAMQATITKLALSARRIANGADFAGSLAARVVLPSATPTNASGNLVWRGRVGTIAHAIDASLDSQRLEATVDAPSFGPNDVRTLWPESTISQQGSFHVRAHGTWPSVDFEGRAALGDAALSLKGRARLDRDKDVHLSLDARRVDLQQAAPSMPSSRLGLEARLEASQTGAGAIGFDASLHFLGGSVGNQAIPAATIVAIGSGPDANRLHAHVDVSVDEPSVPTRLTVDVTPDKAGRRIDAVLQSEASDLSRVPQLGHQARGAARLEAKATLDLGSMVLDARVNASASGVAVNTVSVRDATATVLARGALRRLALDASVHADDVSAAGRQFTHLDLGANGTTDAQHVTASVDGPAIPALAMRADVRFGSGVAIQRLNVDLEREGEHASVAVDSAVVDGGATRVEGARIDGLGWPAFVSFAWRDRTLRLRASSEGIDLGRLGRLLHLEDEISAGTLALHADTVIAPWYAAGKTQVDLSDASLANVHGLTAHVDIAGDGRLFHGEVRADAPDIGSIDLVSPKLDLAALSMASWRQASGELSFHGHADLAKVLALIPPDLRPVGEAKGTATVEGEIERAAGAVPDVDVSLDTKGLSLSANTPRKRDIDGVMVVGPPAWSVRQIDVCMHGTLKGRDGKIDLRAQLLDRKGELATIVLTSPRLPLQDLLDAPARWKDDSEHAPFALHVTVPERGLGGLPDLLKQDVIGGRMKADLSVEGPLLEPHVDLTATLRDSEVRSNSVAMDLDLAARYDGRRATVSLRGHDHDTDLVRLETTLDAAVAPLIQSSKTPPWTASARGHFAGFPLARIPALDNRRVDGRVTGDIRIEGLHDDARAQLALNIEGLRVGAVDYKAAKIDVRADGKTIDCDARIDQSDGFLQLGAETKAAWGRALAPAIVAGQAVDVKLGAKAFRIAALLPLLSSSLDELDGRLDAQMQASLHPGETQASLSGTMSLSKGIVEAAAGGGELHDISASLRFNPDGTVVLERLDAAGLSGRVQGTASARLAGTQFESAHAIFVIPSRQPLPLVVGGTEMGNIDGRVELTALSQSEGRSMSLQVQVPHLRVALPEGISTDVENLGPMDNVHIGAHKGSRDTLLLMSTHPSNPPATVADGGSQRTIKVNLGDVEVVRGTDIKVDLNGALDVTSADKTVITGQIHLQRGGLLNVQGKNFEVQSGTVTLTGRDPSNPLIVVKANWTAPDGTVISANFVGPLKTGQVTLTSEPTLPKEEIVELLLYGTADGQQAQSPPSDVQTTAIATAGGEAAQPLNHALNQLGLGAVTAKVDSQSTNPKPEVEMQIARGISVQLAYVLGVTPPGVNPDKTLISLDWRFLSKWSLESTLGDAGTAIFDLMWQHRY